jgi:hypothetical protein
VIELLVKDLIKVLEGTDQNAHVHIQTQKGFEEDIKEVNLYGDDYENAVLLLSSFIGR